MKDLAALAAACALIACSHTRPAQPPDGLDAAGRVPADGGASVTPSDAAAGPSDGRTRDVVAPEGGEPGADATAVSPECPPCPLCSVSAQCSEGWCLVPSGCFVMGSPASEWGRAIKNEDQVQVTLTHAFLIGQRETTQAQWTALGFPNPSGLMNDGVTGDCTDSPECPLGNITWFEAVAYANAVSDAQKPPLPRCYELGGCTGKMGEGMTCDTAITTTTSIYDCAGVRLPTDAEWEYAARAGSRTAFYSGDIATQPVLGNCYRDANLDRIAWYCDNAGPKTHVGGRKQANGWGLFDMSGNVEEWVNDVYSGTTPLGPLVDPGATLGDAPSRTVRGGLFNVWASVCRSASKLGTTAKLRGPGLGVRLVKPAPVVVQRRSKR